MEIEFRQKAGSPESAFFVDGGATKKPGGRRGATTAGRGVSERGSQDRGHGRDRARVVLASVSLASSAPKPLSGPLSRRPDARRFDRLPPETFRYTVRIKELLSPDGVTLRVGEGDANSI
jgi:hypothetical protein